MTACIDPSAGSRLLSRSDPSTRLSDYKRALNFWLSHPDSRISAIVFVDNSGYPLSGLSDWLGSFSDAKRPVEFLSFSGNAYPAGTDYGYAELGIIDYALACSELLQASTHFLKATGRLTFHSISRLLDHLPGELYFAVDCRRNALFVPSPQAFVTSQLMLFETAFYCTHLLGIRSLMPECGTGVEDLFYKKLLPFHRLPGCLLRWPVNVEIRGVAAHFAGKRYDSPRQRFISLLRAILRRMAPWWWF